jgi:hypothetical protein
MGNVDRSKTSLWLVSHSPYGILGDLANSIGSVGQHLALLYVEVGCYLQTS